MPLGLNKGMFKMSNGLKREQIISLYYRVYNLAAGTTLLIAPVTDEIIESNIPLICVVLTGGTVTEAEAGAAGAPGASEYALAISGGRSITVSSDPRAEIAANPTLSITCGVPFFFPCSMIACFISPTVFLIGAPAPPLRLLFLRIPFLEVFARIAIYFIKIKSLQTLKIYLIVNNYQHGTIWVRCKFHNKLSII